MSKPIELDLRRDLPKVREALDELLAAQPGQQCCYTTPCAIGVMMSPEQRRALAEADCDATAVRWLFSGKVKVPRAQEQAFTDLQIAFDAGDGANFAATLARLESRYLTQPALVQASTK